MLRGIWLIRLEVRRHGNGRGRTGCIILVRKCLRRDLIGRRVQFRILQRKPVCFQNAAKAKLETHQIVNLEINPVSRLYL